MKLLNEKGFTLVEMIVAMALVGVIAVTFIPLMTAQYVNINRTGDKSKVTYKAVEDAEEKINVEESSGTPIAKDGDLIIDWTGKPSITAPIKNVVGEATTEAIGTTSSTATGTAKDSKTEIKAAVPADN